MSGKQSEYGLMYELVKPKVAVSSCLLGHEVRFDGGHKNSRYVSDVLAAFVDYVHFCPEMAIGLGTPRPTLRLERPEDGNIIALETSTGRDHTRSLSNYAAEVVPNLKDCSGYIFKKGSPSCGLYRVKVYRQDHEVPLNEGQGVYATGIVSAYPHLPVEEEGRLQDPRLRDNFIERVFLYARWLALRDEGFTAKRIIDFHTRQKFALLAHDEKTYRELGRLIAEIGNHDIVEFAEMYISKLMAGMTELATPGKHVNVLLHIMGFFKNQLEPADKEELLRLIEDHRQELVPVIVPITLINYFRKRYPNVYIDGQTYLEPHPRELMLRNSL